MAGATALLSRDGLQASATPIAPPKDSTGGKLSKAEINRRDAQGRTVLHLAASIGSIGFVKALLENPATDINVLDTESGWSVCLSLSLSVGPRYIELCIMDILLAHSISSPNGVVKLLRPRIGNLIRLSMYSIPR